MELFSAILLIILTLQRSGASILLHEAGKLYSTAFAVLLGEIVKEIVCFSIAMYQIRQDLNIRLPTGEITTKQSFKLAMDDYKEAFLVFISKVFNRNALNVFIPAALYVVQNNLWLYASSRIEPSTFQALWQLRLLPMAFLSQVILSKKLGIKHWISLCVILGGVITIQQAIKSDVVASAEAQRSSLTALAALSLAAICASLAGVLLEKLFKSEGTNLWVSNFQLSAFSLVPAISVIVYDMRKQDAASFESINIFFKSIMPWTAVCVQGLAGILVALTTKYAGCIAGSISGIASIAVTHLIEILRGKGSDILEELSFLAGFALVGAGVAAYTLLGTGSKQAKTETDNQEGAVHLELEASPKREPYWTALPQEAGGEEEEDHDESSISISAEKLKRNQEEHLLFFDADEEQKMAQVEEARK